jgi:hypothetical protein
MSHKILSVRFPEDLLESYSKEILEYEREKTGLRSLSRNELMIRVLDEHAKVVRKQRLKEPV